MMAGVLLVAGLVVFGLVVTVLVSWAELPPINEQVRRALDTPLYDEGVSR